MLAVARAARPFAARWARTLMVKMHTTPNPDSVKFVPEGERVLPPEMGTGTNYDVKVGAGAPRIVKRLFRIQGIRNVFLGPDFLTVNKHEDLDWETLQPLVLNAIMDGYAEWGHLVEAPKAPAAAAAAGGDASAGAAAGGAGGAPAAAAAPGPDDDVVTMIKELLEDRIRPAVQEDGGDIFFVSFDRETGIVKVKLAGSCQGCPSSSVTLKNGVENMLMHYVPEVTRVESVKDDVEVAGEEAFEDLERKLVAGGMR